jgi:hypothetical protein
MQHPPKRSDRSVRSPGTDLSHRSSGSPTTSHVAAAVAGACPAPESHLLLCFIQLVRFGYAAAVPSFATDLWTCQHQ